MNRTQGLTEEDFGEAEGLLGFLGTCAHADDSEGSSPSDVQAGPTSDRSLEVSLPISAAGQILCFCRLSSSLSPGLRTQSRPERSLGIKI